MHDGSSPPRGVFQAMGVLDVERNTSGYEHGRPPPGESGHGVQQDEYSDGGEWTDEEDRSSEEEDEERGKARYSDGDAAGGSRPSTPSASDSDSHFDGEDDRDEAQGEPTFDGSAGGVFDIATAIDNGIDLLPWGGGGELFAGNDAEGERRGLNSAGSDAHYESRRNRRYVVAFGVLFLFVALALIVFLSPGKDQPISASPIKSDAVTHEYDFTQYGYPHAQETSASPGWISWPRDAEGEFEAKHFYLASASDAVSSPDQCAKLCQEKAAPAGAWSVKYNSCWCNLLVDPRRLCKEPCVPDHYVDFSNQPLDRLGYCAKSVCDREWYHSEEYCEGDVKFDQRQCDATIEAIDSGKGTGPFPFGEIVTEHSHPKKDHDEVEKHDTNNAQTHVSLNDYKNLDLSSYGYAHIHKTSTVGWVSWAPADGDYDIFDHSDGISTIEQCAARCQEYQSPTGLWSVKHGTCTCVQKNVTDLCWEPCIEDAYVDFATEPITWLETCDWSVCNGEAAAWEGSEEYCGEVFDADFCVAKLAEIAAEEAAFLASSTTSTTSTAWSAPEDDVQESLAGPLEAPSASISTADGDKQDPLSTQHDLTAYGFSHIHKTSSIGWVSWVPALVDDGAVVHNYGVPSLEECAAKCQKEKAHTGAWNVKRNSCWCILQEVYDLCWEPCIEDEFIDFATEPITWLDYCEKSVCQYEWPNRAAYCVDEVQFDEGACDAKLATIAAEEEEFAASSTTTSAPDSLGSDVGAGQTADEGNTPPVTTSTNLSAYGYSHIHKTSSVGWVSWAPTIEKREFDLYDDTDGVTSLEDCAAKCQEKEAPTGAWNVKTGDCWCLLKEVSDLCWEPCVEDEYIDFATKPITWLDYCEKSVCTDPWPVNEYCEDDVGFDQVACDAKLANIAKEEEEFLASSSTTTAPDTMDSASDGAADASAQGDTSGAGTASSPYQVERISPSSLHTVKRDDPDGKHSSHNQYLTARDGERISYIKFALASLTGKGEVTKAVLNLYSVTRGGTSNVAVMVDVDALADVGDWSHETVTWNNRLDSDKAFLVKSFSATPLRDGETKHLYEVDVTSAIPPVLDWMTFRLSSVSSVTQEFASYDWNDGEAVPELVVTLKKPTPNPTSEPTSKPTLVPTSEPTTKPTLVPTSEPTAAPTTEPTKKPTTKPTMVPTSNPTLKPTDRPTSNPTISMHGYTHIHKTSSVGWVSWSPALDDKYMLFDDTDGVTTLDECAAKCQENDAPTGAWNVRTGDCWCLLMDVSDLCWEPCVEDEYTDFATEPITWLDYCEKSVCQDEWPNWIEYCEDDVDFDQVACDAKLANIAKEEADFLASSTTVAPDTFDSNSDGAAGEDAPDEITSPLELAPISLLTIKSDDPDGHWGGQYELSIEADAHVSFIKFDLSLIPDTSVVETAVLKLYSIHQHINKDPVTVSVDALQNIGDWKYESVSWSQPLETEASEYVAVQSFSVKSLDDGETERLYDVDVTSAVDHREWITFRLTTDSSITQRFASTKWGDGDLVPKLVVTFSS